MKEINTQIYCNKYVKNKNSKRKILRQLKKKTHYLQRAS